MKESEFVCCTMIAEDGCGNGVAIHAGRRPVVHLGANFHGEDFRPFFEEAEAAARTCGSPILRTMDGRVFIDAALILHICDLAEYAGTKAAIKRFVDFCVDQLAKAEAAKGMN